MEQKLTYQFGKSKLTLEFGDITTSDAQVLVSSDDCYLTMGGGVSAAIRKAGGDDIALDAAKKIPALLGSVVVTTAGTLPAYYIFHAITRNPQLPEMLPEEVLQQATHRCMQLVGALEVQSIAFPAIGAGTAGFSLDKVAAQMAKVIATDFLASDFIAEHELPPLLKAAEEEGLTILWVYLSACLYQETEIEAYQAAHDIARSLDSLTPSEQNAVLVTVCQEIKKAAANPS